MIGKDFRRGISSASGRANAKSRPVHIELLEVRKLLSSVAALTLDNDVASARMLHPAAHVAQLKPVQQGHQAVLQADKADYLPGEVVHLSGNGWQPREAVTIQVSHVGKNSSAGSTFVAMWVVHADKHGAITTSYVVQNSDLNQSLAVTATGQKSGRVASASFQDGTTATVTTVTSSTPAPSAAVLRPDHVVIVMEEDRACGAIGDTTNMPYFNQLAASALVYTNSLGLNTSAQLGEMNYLALFSGSTQGVTDDGRGYSFSGANLGQSLNNAGMSFVGYSESLPADGSQVQQAADPTTDPANHPDLYIRSYNPMAMFTSDGTGKTNADVNKKFAEFPTNYANLPTVSLVVPNTLHSTHGSNESPPYATDPSAYVPLRQAADTWMAQNLNAYVQWARTHNSLLIITTDEQDRAHTSLGLTTMVTGDPRLFVAGTDSTSITHYNILREIENMYGLAPLGNSTSNPGLGVNAQGQLAPGAAAGGAASVYGQSVTFSAKVTPASGTGVPTGTVQFKIDGANFGSAQTLSNGAATSAAITSLAPGSHSITAAYAGSKTYAVSTSSSITQTVAKDSSTTSLSSSAATAPVGQPVTFTAKVAVVSPGAGKPTGSISFMDGNTALATIAVDSTGTATFTTSSLSAGGHTITASYGGDANVNASSSAAISENITGSVTAASTTTGVSASLSTALYGQAITFSATISSSTAGTPSGTVQFYVDGNAFGSPVVLVNAAAISAADSALSPGNHSITAVYSGDAAYQPSTSSSAGVSVNKANTTTALTAGPNPSTFGQSVALSATVSAVAPGAGTPSGFVQFVVDGANFGSPVSMSNGSATLNTTGLAAGSHAITANYLGDANFATSASNSFSQTVNKTSTTTSLTATPNPSTVGQSVALSATVSAVAPGAGTPSGFVQFVVDGANFGSPVPLSNGLASLNTTGLATGSHTIAANYLGDTNFTTSGSNSLSQTVNKSATTTSLTTTPNPSTVGQSVALSATVSAVSPGAGLPSGSVQFVIDGANFGSPVTLTNGLASLSASGLATGSHTITANYLSDANFIASGSNTVSQTVNPVASGLPNDMFAKATAIATTGTITTLTGTNVGATKEAGEPNHAGNAGGKSVWWTWTPTSNTNTTIDTSGSTFDTLLAVYTGSTVSTLTQIAANDDSPAGGTTTSQVTFPAVAGTTYFIAADGYGGVFGAITLHLTTAVSIGPVNNSFANATVITGTSATVTGSNVGATKETGEPTIAGNSGGKSVWWSWTATTSGTVTIDTLGSTFDTLLGVSTGSSVSALTQIAANDDNPAGGTTTSKVTFTAVAGTTYMIAVDGYAGVSGGITMHLSLV